MKRFIAFLLALMMLTASVSAVDLYVDTKKVESEASPVIVDGRTMVPLRSVCDALGITLLWDQSTKTSTGTSGDTQIVIQADNPTAYINGIAHSLDVPAQIINGYMMVPARFVAEALNCDVSWYADTQVAAIAKELKGQTLYAPSGGKTFHYSIFCGLGYSETTLAEVIGRGLKSCPRCVPTTIDFSDRLQVPAENLPEPSTPPVPESAINSQPAKSDTPITTPEVSTQLQSQTVYITRTGECYHYNSHCGRGTYYPTTLDSAIRQGLRPCSKCT